MVWKMLTAFVIIYFNTLVAQITYLSNVISNLLGIDCGGALKKLTEALSVPSTFSKMHLHPFSV